MLIIVFEQLPFSVFNLILGYAMLQNRHAD